MALAIGAAVMTLASAILLAVASVGEDVNSAGLLVAAGITALVAVVAVIDAVQVWRRIRRGNHG